MGITTAITMGIRDITVTTTDDRQKMRKESEMMTMQLKKRMRGPAFALALGLSLAIPMAALAFHTQNGHLTHGERDEYRWEPDQDHMYKLKLDVDHNNARFDISIFDHHHNRVHYVRADDDHIRTRFHAHDDEPYYIEVYARRGHGGYTLSVKDVGHPDDD